MVAQPADLGCHGWLVQAEREHGVVLVVHGESHEVARGGIGHFAADREVGALQALHDTQMHGEPPPAPIHHGQLGHGERLLVAQRDSCIERAVVVDAPCGQAADGVLNHWLFGDLAGGNLRSVPAFGRRIAVAVVADEHVLESMIGGAKGEVSRKKQDGK